MSSAKKSREARGYGQPHRQRRKALETLVHAGLTKCVRCGERIEPGSEWHLDHRDDRLGTLGPSHALCNLQAAAAKSNGQRRKSPKTLWSRVWFTEPDGSLPAWGELTPRAAREYDGDEAA